MFGWGRESEVRILTPNSTVLAFKIWAYTPKIAKNRHFWYKFSSQKKIQRSIEKLEYRCTTRNLPLRMDTLTTLTVHHSVYPVSKK